MKTFNGTIYVYFSHIEAKDDDEAKRKIWDRFYKDDYEFNHEISIDEVET
jgi:hypothetical protein